MAAAPAVRRAALEVGFDHKAARAVETGAIDLKILHDALDVIARLGDRDALDPVDRIDLRVARIAKGGNPQAHAAAPGIVAGEGEDVGAVIAGEQVRQFRRAHLHVVDGVAEQPRAVINRLEFLRRVLRRLGRDLHQAHCVRDRDDLLVEVTFLARDRIGDRVFDRRRERRILRQTDDRISVVVKRQAPAVAAGAEQHHGAAVAVLVGEFAEHRHARRVVGALAELGIHRGDHVALVEIVEQLGRAHDLEIGERRALLRREGRRAVQA